MKQYRLKITWSNGQSEYLTTPHEMTDQKINYDLHFISTGEKNFYIGDNYIVFIKDIRKIEYEEYIPETEVKF
jgi:hypothetical protein